MFVILAYAVSNTVYTQPRTDIYVLAHAIQREWTEDEMRILEELQEHPFALNYAPFESYDVFFFLSEFQKKSLYEFVKRNRPLRTSYELLAVLGFTKEVAMLVAALCTLEKIDTKYTLSEIAKRGKHRITAYYSWLPISEDVYKEEFSYYGKPLKTVYRYRYQSHNKLFWGCTFANDMGEPTQQGILHPQFDYSSAYLQIQDQGYISNVVLGDYRIVIGQGLSLRQGGFYAKNMSSPPIVSAPILRRHTSSNEFYYNRGVGISFKVHSLQITPFFSYKKRDGYFINDSVSFPFHIATTGLHRTQNEIKHKNQISHMSSGLHIQKQVANLTIGTAYVSHIFSQEHIRHTVSNLSFHYLYRTNRTLFFGESAFDAHLKNAHIYGFQIKISPVVESSVIARRYDKEYQSYMSHSFSEFNTQNNEQGIFAHCKAQFWGNYQLTVAHDRYQHKQRPLSHKINGNESYLSVLYTKFARHSIEYKLGYEKKTLSPEPHQLYAPEYETHKVLRHSFRFSYSYNGINSKTTLMRSFATRELEDYAGIYIAQDIQYNAQKNLKIGLRTALFNAPYHTRMYIYEPSVEYAFTTPQILYSGKQVAILCTWDVIKNMSVQFHMKHYIYSPHSILPDYYSLFGEQRKIQYACTASYKF